jgi:hypothetical protein
MASLWACAYRFAESGRLPAGVARVYVSIFDNRTAETGVESLFTNDLIDEFTRTHAGVLTGTRESADGIITGTIVRLSVSDLARSSVSATVEREITGWVRLNLASVDGEILWASGDMVERQAYSVIADDKAATDQNKSVAIAAISAKLAEDALIRMTADF